MIHRTLAALLTLIAAAATVTTALAIASPADPAGAALAVEPQQGQTVIVQKVFIQKAEMKPTPPAKDDRAEEKPVRVLRAAPAPRVKVAKKAEPAPQPAVAAAALMVAPGMAMNNEAQIRQYMQQMRPLLRSEYHIVRVVCRPTPEQRKELARAGEKALHEAIRKYVEIMQRPMGVNERAQNQPGKLIRAALLAAVKAKFPPEVASCLDAEGKRREASRKSLFVRNLVARLDHELVLDPGQRDKLAESLEKHWDDSWGQSIEMFMYDYQYVPPIPDHLVTPVLNEAQRRIWRTTQKVQMFFGGFGLMGGVMVDDPLEDPELKEARIEAEKNNPVPAPGAGAGAPVRILRRAGAAVQKAQAPREAVQLKVIRKQAAPTTEKKAQAAEKKAAPMEKAAQAGKPSPGGPVGPVEKAVPALGTTIEKRETPK
ncbi:MAG: hypothetical protein ACYC61_00035 [Isosphaeraceae bacterium]